jgi:hypothetical protein
MKKSSLLASTLGLALLVPPAMAQPMDQTMRPSAQGQGQAPARADSAAQGETHRAMRHRDGPHAAPRHHGGRHAAERAANRMDAAELVQEASRALRAGRTAEENELIEQSETRLLTRSATADRAAQPARGPVLEQLAAARGAIRARDRAGALREMDQAMAGLRMGGGTAASEAGSGWGMGAATGAGSMGASPAQGGGAGEGRVGQTMRDGGPAGATMSRADGITRVQAGGSPPGSPGMGHQGSGHPAPGATSPRPGNPMQGGPNRDSDMRTGSSGVASPPPPGVTPGNAAPQVSGSGRSSSGGAVSTGIQGTGNGPAR